MHLSTTARFLADGDMFGVTSILNGIRQGCPLAPVLFILALDLLYKAADADPNLTGLQVDANTRVKLSGYADDTTSYLAHPDEERYLLRLLDQFSAASGLRINLSKSLAIVIHPEGPTAAHAQMTIPVQPTKELLRYLGMAVASNPSTAAIWTRTLQQVRATLHVAYAKTTNLSQRVALCSAVIMPKLLFVGRHSWPTSAIFTDLQSFLHRYAWHGSLAHAASGRRAWMSAKAAMLPPAQGGIGLPDVRASFIKMSASVVARWHASSNPVAAAAGQVLLRLRGGGPAARVPGPSRAAPPPPRVSPSLAATGTATQRAAGAMPREPEERTALATLLPVTGRGPAAVKWWDRGWFHCTYKPRATDLERLRLIQHRRYGDFNLAALLACQAVGADILALGAHAVERRDFPQLIHPGDAINDIVRMQWVGHLDVRFQCVRHAWPISPRVVAQFRRFCDVLVHNYPGVLRPHNGPLELQPRPPTFSEWHITVTPDGLKSLICAPVPGARIDLGPVATLRVASRVARRHEPTLVRFDPYAPIWTSRHPDQRPTPPANTRGARARAEITGRARRALADDPLIGAALATITWKTLHSLPGSSSAQRLLLHKVKGLRLSGWVRSSSRRGCPHCATPTSGPATGHTYHIVWHCAAAHILWQQFCAAWTRLGVACEPQDPALCTAVFSLRPLQTPAITWSLMGSHRPSADLVQAADAAIALLWQQQVLGCIQRIWQWRQGVQDEVDPWTLAVASAALHSSLRSAYTQVLHSTPTLGPQAVPLRRLLLGLQRAQLTTVDRVTRRPRLATDQHLLFFDGGSRGNPGPGGSGAVIVRVDAFGGSPVVVWVASMSLASPTTTNNQAEYFGLVTGLLYAAARRLRPLTVVGDSALIINQLRDHRAPKDPVLRTLYARARVLADSVSVERWRHHVRAYNQMADCAANLAMDSKRSVQILYPTARPRWSALALCVAEDVGHWQAEASPGMAS